jgi:hypothetical protein
LALLGWDEGAKRVPRSAAEIDVKIAGKTWGEARGGVFFSDFSTIDWA